jgi:hypothetical protein
MKKKIMNLNENVFRVEELEPRMELAEWASEVNSSCKVVEE